MNDPGLDQDREDEYTREEVQQEENKVRQLRRLVDFTCMVLYQQPMSMDEAERLIRGVRKIALNLFPDKEETFDLIYGARFRRILCERFHTL